MNKFYDILKSSSRNKSKEIRYSETDAQPLYRMIQEYCKQNPYASNSEVYEYLLDLFNTTNMEMVQLPTVRSDTIRYNICKYLNRNPDKRKENYDTIIREEKSGKKLKYFESISYNSNRKRASRMITLQALGGLREHQKELAKDEEIANMVRNFFKYPKKIQNERKRQLDSEGRRNLEELRIYFEGDEYQQFSAFLGENEKILAEDLKKDYIDSIVFIGEKFKQFNLLGKYQEFQTKMFKNLGVEELSYPLSEDEENTISVESLFKRENLDRLDINKLSMLNAFWINRFTKELDSLNKTFFIVNSLGLWSQIRSTEPDPQTGDISIKIEEDELNKLYDKMHFLQEATERILSEFTDDMDAEFSEDEKINASGVVKNTIKKMDPEPIINRMDFEIGEEYEQYFLNQQPDLSHSFKADLENYRVMENAIHNAYKIKDYNMIAILSNLYQEPFAKNWGVILEEGKKVENSGMILLGIDVDGFNMPIRLHIEKSLVKEFLRANQNTSKIPIYEGANDFKIQNANISTPILMPLCKKQYKGLKDIKERLAVDSPVKKFVSHIAFLADSKEYPEHLREEVQIKKKGKIKISRKIPAKKYIDLDTGKQYRESKTGEYEEIVEPKKTERSFDDE